jgi:DNA (cytosine-5)-methyltransferase 1
MTLGVWEAARRHRRRLEIRFSIDLAREPLAVYRNNFANFAHCVREDDVARIFSSHLGSKLTAIERYWTGRIGALDLIVAGPPCQGHSDLNNSTRRKDPRNSLYLRVVRAIEIVRPKAVIVENVPAVLLDKTKVVTQAVAWLKTIGYQVKDNVVSLGPFQVPQNRRRHFLVAVRDNDFEMDDLTRAGGKVPTVGKYLAGLEDEPDRRVELFYRPAVMTRANKKRVEWLFKNDIFDLPDSQRPPCHRDKRHAYVSMYGRMHWEKPAQTLTSGFGSMGQGRYVHPRRKRMLSPHEAARLQGFPDFFDFSSAATLTGLREMIANAVPPQGAATIVDRLICLGLL